MPKDAHTTAAYHHERAAKSHRSAAGESGRGAHGACAEHAVAACGHSTRAEEASKLASEKSVERAKGAPVGVK
jgi:hypothetical protein